MEKLMKLLGAPLHSSEALHLARENPSAYITSHRKRLRERGIRSTSDCAREDLVEIALLDELILASLAVEVDWRETPGIVAEGLNEILAEDAPSEPSAVVDECGPLEVARAYARALDEARSRFVLMAYPFFADSLVFVRVRRDRIEEVQGALRECDFKSLKEI